MFDPLEAVFEGISDDPNIVGHKDQLRSLLQDDDLADPVETYRAYVAQVLERTSEMDMRNRVAIADMFGQAAYQIGKGRWSALYGAEAAKKIANMLVDFRQQVSDLPPIFGHEHISEIGEITVDFDALRECQRLAIERDRTQTPIAVNALTSRPDFLKTIKEHPLDDGPRLKEFIILELGKVGFTPHTLNTPGLIPVDLILVCWELIDRGHLTKAQYESIPFNLRRIL